MGFDADSDSLVYVHVDEFTNLRSQAAKNGMFSIKHLSFDHAQRVKHRHHRSLLATGLPKHPSPNQTDMHQTQGDTRRGGDLHRDWFLNTRSRQHYIKRPLSANVCCVAVHFSVAAENLKKVSVQCSTSSILLCWWHARTRKIIQLM